MINTKLNLRAFCILWATIGVLIASASAQSAQAADWGGDCCADLEERIAELEETTARKGNRKVSLTVSGWVNQAVFFWDDGTESNAYVGTNALEQDRVIFSGDAKIAKGWYAGYLIEFGLYGASSKLFSQTDPGTGNNLETRKSYWFLKSKKHGKLSVGLNGTATYHLLNDANGTNTRYYADAEAAAVALGSFKIRQNSAYVNKLKWKDLLQGAYNDTPGQNGRRNIVRYDSPKIAGFMLSASWGEDDMWDTALTYKGKIGNFKLVGKIGYGQNTDSNTSYCNKKAGKLECEWWGAGATVMHKPTGLYVYGAYGEQQDDSEKAYKSTADDTDTVWYIQTGIEQKWASLGKTTVFVEYRRDDAGTNLSKYTGGTTYIQNSDIDHWAAGLVQNVENAAMDLYVIYRHSEGDFTNSAGSQFSLDDFDMVISGARIQF
jgi:predicted porin